MARTLLAPVSFGLGDLVVSLPAIQALLDEGLPVWLVARAPSQTLLAHRIAGLAGAIAEDALRLERDDHLIDLRDHPLQRDFWWGSPEFEAAFGPMNINEILDRICADLGIKAKFDSPVPLRAERRAGLDRTVLLVHETDGQHKQWPPDRWAAVVAGLRQHGHDVAHVMREKGPSPLDLLDVPALVVPTPGDAVDALSSCRGVIGVDTGLTHIATQQGTPTVTICRQSTVYFRPWPHCRALRGDRCTDACLAAETNYAYNTQVSLRDFKPAPRSCPSAASCFDRVRPEDAVTLLSELL